MQPRSTNPTAPTLTKHYTALKVNVRTEGKSCGRGWVISSFKRLAADGRHGYRVANVRLGNGKKKETTIIPSTIAVHTTIVLDRAEAGQTLGI